MVDRKATDEAVYLSAIEEGEYIIAQANARINDKGELADELPRYAMHKTKVGIQPAQIGPLLDQLTKRFPEATVDQLDGLRCDWDDRWVLIRASNTEPIVRIISEAPSVTAAESLCTEIGDLLR